MGEKLTYSLPDKDLLIRQKASEWLLQLIELKRKGQNTSELDEEWRAWLNEDPKHESTYFEVESIWRQIQQAAPDSTWPSTECLNADDYDGEEDIDNYLARTQLANASINFEQDVSHTANKSVIGYSHNTEYKQINTKSTWRNKWIYFGAAASIIIAVISFFIFNQFPQTGVDIFKTPIGGHQYVNLSDGSGVTLGANSQILVKYNNEQRHITLDYGEALFEVKKDPDRAFIVQAGRQKVVAIGTAFNIRKTDAVVTVTVIEGVVGVEEFTTHSSLESSIASRQDVAPKQLRKGEQVRYVKSNINIPKVVQTDVEQVLAWRKGLLTFKALPLAEVIANINRYNRKTIEIADPQIGKWLFTGSIRQSGILDWMETLPEVFPVKIIQLPDRQVLVLDRD